MIDSQVTKTSDDINSRIALRVRSLRTSLGLSLEGLAERSDVSRAMISLIERGESNPTAVVLEKISTGLGVSLASLFEDTSSVPTPVSHARDRKTWQDPDSGYLRCNISPPNFPSPIQIVEVTLPAGANVAYESRSQTRETHEQVWVLEGKMDVKIGETTHPLAKGDCLAFKLDCPTSFFNPGSKRCHYVVVIASL